MSCPEPEQPQPAPEPEPHQLPLYPARMVDRKLFIPVFKHPGQDPQSLPRLVLPCCYVLRLPSPTGPWFYIGVSSDVVSRIGQHFAGCGSILTRKYPPVCVEHIFYNCDKQIESEIVLFYARHFGSGGSVEKFGPKVRGGRWSGVHDVVPCDK